MAEDKKKEDEKLFESAKRRLEESKEDVGKRELADRIVKGLGKIGAGVAGQKTGLQLGDVKFDKQDFRGEKRDARQDYQQDIEDIRRKQLARRQDAQETRAEEKHELATGEEAQKRITELHDATISVKNAQAAYYKDKGDTGAKKVLNKAIDKKRKLLQENIDTLKKNVIAGQKDLIKIIEDGTEDEFNARFSAIMFNDFGVDAATSKKIIDKAGGFNYTDDDRMDLVNKLTKFYQGNINKYTQDIENLGKPAKEEVAKETETPKEEEVGDPVAQEEPKLEVPEKKEKPKYKDFKSRKDAEEKKKKEKRKAALSASRKGTDSSNLTSKLFNYLRK